MIYHPILGQLLTSSSDGSVRVWSLPSGSLLQVIPNGHTDSVTALAIAPNMNILATASADLSLKLWSADGDYKCLRTLQGHGHTVTGAAFVSHSLLLSCSHDGTLRLWDTATGFCARVFRAGRWVRCVSAPVRTNHSRYYAVDGTTAAVGGANAHRRATPGSAGLLEYANSAARRQAAANASSSPPPVSAGDVSAHTPVAEPVDRLFTPIAVSGDNEGLLAVWDLRPGAPAEPALLLAGHEGPVQSVLVLDDEEVERSLCTSFGLDYSSTPDGAASGASEPLLPARFILSAGRDKTVRLWDRRSSDCLWTLECGNWVSGIAAHPNNKYIFVSGDDRLVRVLDCSKRLREVARVPMAGFAGAMTYCGRMDLLCVALGDGGVSVLQCQDPVEALLKNKRNA
jgi:platelet-activating factor acetylhydrolase IB subunit alpha